MGRITRFKKNKTDVDIFFIVTNEKTSGRKQFVFENKDTVAALVTLTHPGLRQKKAGSGVNCCTV